MSNYGSMPPPGAYTPPNQGASQQQQQQSYQPGAPTQGQSGHAHKPGGAFGQMMNQAVTTGKPMLNKLQKTISSKLGGKPAASGPPQHLQSYQNYQQHQGQGQPQGFQQQQGQSYSPQAQQQQWQKPQQPPPAQAPNAYAAQQSPFQQSTYGTPASGYSGQSNYFPPQVTQPSPVQTPPTQPPNVSNYDSTAFNPGGNMGSGQQSHAQQGQYSYQGQPQAQFQQDMQLQGSQYPGQQTGVVGITPSPGYSQSTQVPHMGDVSPLIPPNKPAMQTQWGHPSASEQLPPPASQQPFHSPTPPQQHFQNPMPTPQQHFQNPMPTQQQAHDSMAIHEPHQTVPSPPLPHEQQQWNQPAPMSPGGHNSVPAAPVSPPPPQMHAQPPSQPTQPLTPAPQHTSPISSPTEFIAELPADMGNLGLAGSKGPSASPYQAYTPSGAQAESPTNRFSVPRRAVSSSSLPLADPWRFADPITEQPTREFYILADLVFDALDRKFEPQNTGLLEAPKILKSWTELTEDAHGLFSYNSYTALARMWSLEGVPHIMVPVQSLLTPIWNFNQHSHAQDLKVVTEAPSSYATYMPALNRAGWYKFFFLEAMHSPDDMCKLLPTLCADSYKPGVLNHPDLNRRDRSDIPALQARAAAILSNAIKRVCEEAKAAMVHDPNP